MRECTSTSEAVKKAILERMRAGKADNGGARVTKPTIGAQKALKVSAVAGRVGAGQCVVTIPGIDLGTALHALLDFGGSSGVASRSLYDMLERLTPGSWDVRKLTRHQVWEGFGKVQSSSTGTLWYRN
jgi:hypothetical protein